MKNTDQHLGGGSGGGALDPAANHIDTFDGAYSICANQIEISSIAPLPPAIPNPSQITIQAVGIGLDGNVDIRGATGVRLTAGPPPLPPTSSESTNGVEVAVGEAQSITLQRGLLGPLDQSIEMAPGAITVDAGMGQVTIKSLTQITLSVCGGLSTITLGPEGVTIKGILVQIN